MTWLLIPASCVSVFAVQGSSSSFTGRTETLVQFYEGLIARRDVDDKRGALKQLPQVDEMKDTTLQVPPVVTRLWEEGLLAGINNRQMNQRRQAKLAKVAEPKFNEMSKKFDARSYETVVEVLTTLRAFKPTKRSIMVASGNTVTPDPDIEVASEIMANVMILEKALNSIPFNPTQVPEIEAVVRELMQTLSLDLEMLVGICMKHVTLSESTDGAATTLSSETRQKILDNWHTDRTGDFCKNWSYIKDLVIYMNVFPEHL